VASIVVGNKFQQNLSSNDFLKEVSFCFGLEIRFMEGNLIFLLPSKAFHVQLNREQDFQSSIKC